MALPCDTPVFHWPFSENVCSILCMQIVRVKETGIEAAAARAAGELRSGKIVIMPTDTLYGVAVDAFSNEAVDRVYDLKGRDEHKPIHCIVRDLETASEYAKIDPIARVIADRFLPGPLTIVVRKKDSIETGIGRNIATIGIRIPNEPFCLALAAKFERPFTTTSANKSGMPPEFSIGAIVSQFGSDATKIDLVIDAGELPRRAPSTIVDISNGDVVILREGAVSAADIFKAVADGTRI